MPEILVEFGAADACRDASTLQAYMDVTPQGYSPDTSKTPALFSQLVLLTLLLRALSVCNSFERLQQRNGTLLAIYGVC
jgi:hypothetical protein